MCLLLHPLIMENFIPKTPFLIFSLFAGSLFLCYFFNILWLKPWIHRWKLKRQGIKGPQPSFIYGNVKQMHKIQEAAMVNKIQEAAMVNKIQEAAMVNKKKTYEEKHVEFVAHDYTSTLFPYFEQWRKEYGNIYTYSTGNKQHVYVNDPELVKEMNQSGALNLGKPAYVTKRLAPLLGNGILRANGHIWAKQRKIIAPEFFGHKVKGMVDMMLQSTKSMITKWDDCITSEGGMMAEISVGDDLRGLSADIISKTCFGSSFSKGKQIFSKLRALQSLIANKNVLFGLPALGLLSSKKQNEMNSLEKEIGHLIWETVEERKKESLRETSSNNEKDFLQLILEGALSNVGKDLSKKFIVDNCKNIYFAGNESTAVAASWCLMLLALHPEWQDHIRKEISQVCPFGALDSHSLSKVKTLTMAIQEVLRLYPPGAFVSREALQENTQIGHISVPKGVCIWTLIPTLHRDVDMWGTDVNEFKPERFAKGVSNACKIPQVYVPFGLGPRLCLGRHFAMLQLKVVLALIISNFTFSLSPNYRHSPTYKMIVEPGHGVQIVIKRLD